MKQLSFLIIFFCAFLSVNAQYNSFDISTSSAFDKTKDVGIKKDRKDKFGYNAKIEAGFMKAGYSVSIDTKSFYVVEYYVGPQPKRGEDDFTFRIKLFESLSGKFISTGVVVSPSRKKIEDNLQSYINQFVSKL